MKFKWVDFDNRIDYEKIVSNPEYFDKNKNFTDDGLFSEVIFGKLLTDHEYSCRCGKYVGKEYSGFKCDECGHYIEKTESNIEKIGWIVLPDGVKLISYIYFKMLEKLIGKRRLISIIDYQYTLQTDGFIVEQMTDPEEPYMGIGVTEFYKNYEEILNHYYKIKYKKETDPFKKQDIKKLYQLLLKNKKYVFINKIPVISVSLRPVIKINDTFKFDEINDAYSSILHECNIFYSKVKGEQLDIVLESSISKMQIILNQLGEKIISTIEGKTGVIRGSIMGTRINFSSRCVISPQSSGYRFNEIVLPYLAFLELYKFELINDIKKFHRISFMDAEKIWFNATLKFDKFVYKRIKKMIENENCAILLNRNPTISYGSILYLRVADVKSDYTDLTATVNNTILSLLAGDYDGDVLNIISIKDNEMKEIFKNVFDPERLVIDVNDSRFNEKLNLERDQVLGIFSLNTQ